MNKPTKSLVVPTIITCTFAWVWFISHAVESKNGGTNESINATYLIERVKENTITSKVDSFYMEYERLEEEERKRLEELERQRLERLEKIRLEKIEEAKKITEQKRIEELKKQQQQEKVISRGDTQSNGDKSYYSVTFYTAGVESTGKNLGDKGYGVTASGTTVSEGRTVACPKSISFGTKIHIEGFGYRICEDRGGAIVEGHLDIYVDSLTKARKLGRQKLLVTILNN